MPGVRDIATDASDGVEPTGPPPAPDSPDTPEPPDTSDGSDGNDESPSTPSAPTPPPLDPADRRRLRRVWIAATLPLLVLYSWMVTTGWRALFQGGVFTEDFYDLQGRAMLDGRLDVPAEAVSIEGFLIDGKTYIYFGPFSSLIRMPIQAVTDAYDGTLTSLSMLAAAVVLAVAAFRLFCELRPVTGRRGPVTRTELVLAGVLAVATLASPILFLSSTRLVYHEASLWGAVLCVAAYASVARWQRAPSGRQLAVTASVICLALLSRQAVAVGPLLALALVGLIHLRRLDDDRPAGLGPADRARRLGPAVGVLTAAGLLALLPSVGVHYAKFGQIYNLPMDRHVQSLEEDSYVNRAAVLEAHANMQGPEYMTTTLLQYLRPDALEFRAQFPWIDFPSEGPTPVDSSVIFDELDWSSSIPSTMPVPTVLSLVALAVGVRHLMTRRRSEPEPAPRLWPLVVGGIVGCFAVVQLGYVAHRYLGDLVPLFLVAGFAGGHHLLGLLAGRRALLRRAALGGLVFLALGSVLVNTALALSYQRERGHTNDRELLAEYVGWRLSLPGDPPVAELPSEAGHGWAVGQLPDLDDGTLLVIGDCDQLLTRVAALSLGEDRWMRIDDGPDDELCRDVQALGGHDE